MYKCTECPLIIRILFLVMLLVSFSTPVWGDYSVGIMGGGLTASHSGCDSTNCLEGDYLVGVTMDYNWLDSRDYTIRTGIGYYHLEYQDDGSPASSEELVAALRPGVILWDVLEPHAVIGYGTTFVYGGGISFILVDEFSFDAEYLFFDDGCDQHKGYVAGFRWTF